jgi:hypothetical protein
MWSAVRKVLVCLLVWVLFAALALLVGDANYRATAIGSVPLLTSFARLGVKKPDSLTPMEFALASAHQLEPYADAATQTDFLQVTLGYLRAAYGNGAATDDDLARAKRYYRTFYKRVARQVGKLRWLWKFWHL